MDNDTIKKEFASLLRGVNEQVAYLKEIGVTNADVKLPDVPSLADVSTVKETQTEPVDRLKKFIPDENVAAQYSSPSKPKPVTPPARRRALGDSKLSKLKIAPTRRKPVANSPEPISLEQQMPKEPKLKETMFGDISEALPESTETLEVIRSEIGANCDRCGLCEKRTQVVHSKGDPHADLMFIGEAPGADEDEQGAPFVGRAGKLLTKIIEAIDLTREDVFIGNINRCRPPGNRQPLAEEAEVCKPFLLREIAVVRPKVIVVMGNTACQNLLETKVGITKLRGSFKNYFGVKVMPTFHPAYLLRDPRKKREVWEDMKTVRAYLDEA